MTTMMKTTTTPHMFTRRRAQFLRRLDSVASTASRATRPENCQRSRQPSPASHLPARMMMMTTTTMMTMMTTRLLSIQKTLNAFWLPNCLANIASTATKTRTFPCLTKTKNIKLNEVFSLPKLLPSLERSELSRKSLKVLSRR